MANFAKPHIEKLLLRQRAKAVKAINKTTSDIQGQYDKALTERTEQVTVATAGEFLNALAFQDNKSNPNKVRGSRMACERDTDKPMHVLPKQYLFFKGDTKCYFHCYHHRCWGSST